MPDRVLRLIVRTPHEVVFDGEVVSVRVPTESGQVGLRSRMEAVVLAVETGLVLARTRAGMTFVGTAGGLLSCDGAEASLLTPLGVVGGDAPAIREALDRALAEPRSELAVRAALDKLESRILTELRREPAGRPLAAGDET
jgi:F0F1-type ATP synthase epsilon subunit